MVAQILQIIKNKIKKDRCHIKVKKIYYKEVIKNQQDNL